MTNQGAGSVGRKTPALAAHLHREYNGATTSNTQKGMGTGRAIYLSIGDDKEELRKYVNEEGKKTILHARSIG